MTPRPKAGDRNGSNVIPTLPSHHGDVPCSPARAPPWTAARRRAAPINTHWAGQHRLWADQTGGVTARLASVSTAMAKLVIMCWARSMPFELRPHASATQTLDNAAASSRGEHSQRGGGCAVAWPCTAWITVSAQWQPLHAFDNRAGCVCCYTTAGACVGIAQQRCHWGSATAQCMLRAPVRSGARC